MLLALKENRTNQMNFSYPWPVRPIYHSKQTSISKNQELLNLKRDAINSTIEYYYVMAFAYPFIGLTMVSSRALQAVSIAWPMILITLLRVIILQC